MGVSDRERKRETKPWEIGGEQTDGASPSARPSLLLLIGRMQEKGIFCLALLLSTQQCVSEFNIQDPRCNPCVCVYYYYYTTKNARTATEIFNEESPQPFVSPKLASFTRDTVHMVHATHPIMQNPWIFNPKLALSLSTLPRLSIRETQHSTWDSYPCFSTFSLFSVCCNNTIKNQTQKSRATRVNFFFITKIGISTSKINKTLTTHTHSDTQRHIHTRIDRHTYKDF